MITKDEIHSNLEFYLIYNFCVKKKYYNERIIKF